MMRRTALLQILFLLFVASPRARAQEEYLPELVRRIKPSVVSIITYDGRGQKLSRGSGFFIAADRAVTNRHVIEGAYKAEVHLSNGNTFQVKGVLAVDGEGDVALLQVDAPPNAAAPLQLVRTSPQEGEAIVVIGNPLGLEGSVSNGIVSAVRDIPNFGRIIQITAPISPGSSGSPVVNMQGQVIGVATLQLAEGQSLNFAVPSERIAQLQAGTLKTLGGLSVETSRSQRAAAERFYNQGLAFLSRDDCETALVYFKKATDADPRYAEPWAQSGFCQGKLGHHEEALKASRQAITLRPDSFESYMNIGAAYFALGQYRESLDAYRKAVTLRPESAEAYYYMGRTYGKMGRTDDELASYKRAVMVRPDFVLAYERLGQGYQQAGRLREAVWAFSQQILYRPDDYKARNNLGEVYMQMNRYQDAIEAFQYAINLKPDFAKARYNLGSAYVKIGNRDAAMEQYRILINLDPEWADRLSNLLPDRSPDNN